MHNLGVAAEQAHAADAASRPQDPSFFEGWNWPEGFPDLLVAPPLKRNTLARAINAHLPSSLAFVIMSTYLRVNGLDGRSII
jgi:hypothetical protein